MWPRIQKCPVVRQRFDAGWPEGLTNGIIVPMLGMKTFDSARAGVQ